MRIKPRSAAILLAALASMAIAAEETSRPKPQGPKVATEMQTLHEDADIWGLDFSPDGKLLATVAPDSLAIRLWDWRAGRVVRTLERPRGGNLAITERIRFSPDGRMLASCSSPSGPNRSVVRIWNVETGEIIHDIEEHESGGCEAVGFTLDSRHLVRITGRKYGAPQDNLIVYETATWQVEWGMHLDFTAPKHFALSPDGQLAALTCNPPDQILIVDLLQRKVIRTIEPGALRLAWSPDGRYLVAAGGVEPLTIYDAQTGERVGTEKAENGRVLVRYTPDGKYLIESIHVTVKIWDGQHRVLYQEIKAMPGSLAVSADGRYFAMGGDKKVILWELK